MSESAKISILTGLVEFGLLLLAILGIVYWSMIVYFARKQRNRSVDQPEERAGMSAFYGLAIFALVINVLFAVSIGAAFFVRLYTEKLAPSKKLLNPASADYSPLLLTTVTWIYIFLAIISGRMATYIRSSSNDLKTGTDPFGSKFINTLYSFSIALTIIYLISVAIIVLTVLFRKNIALDSEEKSKSVLDTNRNFFLDWFVYPFIDNPTISWLLVALVLFITALIVILVGLDQFHVRRTHINSGNSDEARKTKNRIIALVTCGVLLLVASFVALYSVFFNSSYKSLGKLIIDKEVKDSLLSLNIEYTKPFYTAKREGGEIGGKVVTYYNEIPPTRLLYVKDGVYVAINDEIEKLRGHLYKVIPLGMQIGCKEIKNHQGDIDKISEICGIDIGTFIRHKENMNAEILEHEGNPENKYKGLRAQSLTNYDSTRFKGERGLRNALKEVIDKAKEASGELTQARRILHTSTAAGDQVGTEEASQRVDNAAQAIADIPADLIAAFSGAFPGY